MLNKYTLSFFILLCSSVFVFGTSPVKPAMFKKVNEAKMQQWVDSVYNQMTPDERIGQMIVLHCLGDNTESNRNNIANLVAKIRPGGILFLKSTPTNQAQLTNMAQSKSKLPLMVTADAEWGLSMRLSNTTRFPKNMMLGAISNDSLLYAFGKEMARQCKLMGIQVNFAPDVDVNSNPNNPVIGTRSFGEDPQRVSELGIAFSKGLESNGVLSVAKHFPGHGDTSTDSHQALPLIEHNIDRLKNVELVPFQQYINAGLGGVMVGHLSIPALDKNGEPSSLSRPIITDLLKNRMGFDGIVFTDGLAMQGVAKEPDMSLRAIKAGNDILLGPINPTKEFNALKTAYTEKKLTEAEVEVRCKNILRYKYLLGLNNYKPIELSGLSEKLNSPQAELLNRKLNEKAITLLKNEDQIIPLKKLDQRKIAVISLGGSANNTFVKTLKQYDNVAVFTASSSAEIATIKNKIAGYNTVIVSIHSIKAFSAANVDDLITGKESVLAFFVTPYSMSKFASSVKKTDAVVMAYEDTRLAQDYAAQGIFGGNAIEGRLPVSIGNLFKKGEGISTNKTRLAYSIPEEIGVKSEKLARIDSIVKEGLDAHAYPGCQVLVAKDGVVIYNKGFGFYEYNNVDSVSETSIYDLASMTKASATIPAIMKLYDDKQISLQTPISKYVRQLKNTDKEDITIRQALFHETGLTSFIQYYLPAIDRNSYSGRLISYKADDSYPALIDNGAWARTDFKYKPNLISKTSKPGFAKQIAEGLYINDAYGDTIVQRIVDSKLRAKKSYLYSCLNFMLLKEAVEGVAKTDLNTFLQDNFYKKLGASTTTYNPLTKFDKEDIVPTEQDDFLRKQLLQGYVHDEGAAFMGGISGNAGLFSDANDLAKLFQMWLNKGIYGDEEYLSKKTVDLFTLTKSPNSRRGLGFDKPDMFSSKASPTSPSSPASVYGHTGFTGTCFWVDPDNNLIYIFLSNRVNPSRTSKELMKLNIRPRIQEVIYNAIK